MTRSTIGILGGMGPAATILLQQRILDAVQAETDSDHIPLVIDMNPQVPSRIDYLIRKRGENPGPILARMAQRLEALGVGAIAMPCCTAHHFAPDIMGASSVPFLNMVDLTAEAIAQAFPTGSWVGILASPANWETKLFDKALGRHGLTPLYPKDRARVLASIERIKAKGAGPFEIAEVQAMAAELVDEGADSLLIGCSEFSLLSRLIVSNVKSFDALDVLTEAIIGFLHRTAVKA